MIAVFGALKYELRSIYKLLQPEETSSQQPWRAFRAEYAGKEILLVHTGVGREKAEAATEGVLAHYPVSTLVSLGFAGALEQTLAPGDLVLCQHLLSTSGSEPCESDSELIARAASALQEGATRFITGSTITADHLVEAASDKAALGSIFGAHIVEMESYWIAKSALARKVPFLAVRTVSDTMDQSLPPLDRFIGPSGELRQTEALRHFVGNPRDLAKLPQIYTYARRARESLARFFRAYIPKL